MFTDTVGVVTAIAHVKAVYPKGIERSVRNISISDGREVAVVALWGPHADQFDALGIHAPSIHGPVAVLFIGLTVGLYDVLGKLSLQGSSICQSYANAPIPKIIALQNRYKLAVLATDPSDISKADEPIAEFILFDSMAGQLIGAPVLSLTSVTPEIHCVVPPQITRLYK